MNLVRRLLIAAAVAAALFTASCPATTSHPAASVAPLPPDPHTAAALLKIAAAFNHDYDTGDYGPVYTRGMRATRRSSPAPATSNGTRTARAVRRHCRRPKASARRPGWGVGNATKYDINAIASLALSKT